MLMYGFLSCGTQQVYNCIGIFNILDSYMDRQWGGGVRYPYILQVNVTDMNILLYAMHMQTTRNFRLENTWGSEKILKTRFILFKKVADLNNLIYM